MVIIIPTGWAKMLRIVAIECLKTSDPSFARFQQSTSLP